jgi:hypothetical protein
MEFDPQEWESLARNDPDEFDRRRRAAIDAVIACAPAALQDRLRGLQCRVDLELRKARTPLAGALRLQVLMWDRFEMLRAALNGDRPGATSSYATGADNVVPFARRP